MMRGATLLHSLRRRAAPLCNRSHLQALPLATSDGANASSSLRVPALEGQHDSEPMMMRFPGHQQAACCWTAASRQVVDAGTFASAGARAYSSDGGGSSGGGGGGGGKGGAAGVVGTPQSNEGDDEAHQQQDRLQWPLSASEMSNLDEELQDMMELDIFAERDRLPEAVREAVLSRDPQAASAMPGSEFLISRQHLESLTESELQELLIRVGEDSKGPKHELEERVFALLAELLEVLQDQGGKDLDWGLDFAELDGDEQRDFARVFTPEEVADMLVMARTEDVAIVDLRKVDEMRFTDFFVLATARSERHMMASAGAIVYALKQKGCYEVIPGKAPVVEGDAGAQWVCVDAGSIVVHVFLGEARQRVDLESLWVDKLGASRQAVEQPETIHTIKTMRLDDDDDTNDADADGEEDGAADDDEPQPLRQ